MSDDIDRTDEYLELTIEDERREAAAGNGWPDHIPLPTEPPDDDPYRNNTHEPGDEDGDDDEPTTWEPIDLGPWMNGEITQPEPSLGITRSDGQRLIYPGREHAVLGEPNPAKPGWRWAASPPNSPQATTSSTSTTKKATPAAPSNDSNCSTSTPP